MNNLHSFGASLTCIVLMMVLFKGDESACRNNVKKEIIPAIISETVNHDLSIKEGYVSQKKEIVKIIRNEVVVAKVKMEAPVLVAQAEKEEPWGFFQFPGIGRTDDGRLVVGWQMNEDSYKEYGERRTGRMISRDEGRTWESFDIDCYVNGARDLETRDGDVVQIFTPASKNIRSYNSFPKVFCNDMSLKMNYYLESELPDDLRGMYLNIRDRRTKKITRIHGELDDPGLIRYAIEDLMPLAWWGEIKELKDGSLVGGIYGCYYNNYIGATPKSGITFYKSNDGGHHWKAIGKIIYSIDEIKDKSRKYDRLRGFSEVTFEILKNGTYFCVLRTGYNTPMYKAFSYDEGQNWTAPEPFTSNGVKPKLLQLGNGILVLASGRPGLQLRFCIDGDGKTWTEPIDMIPYMGEKGRCDMWAISCGYPALLKVNENTFYLVYSDFTKKNVEGECRKSIMFRKISVVK